MIKDKELVQYQQPYYYTDGSGVTLEAIQQTLMDSAARYQIPVQFYSDQITKGMVSGALGALMGASGESCIVLHHPQHLKDYFKFAFTIGRQGTMAFVAVYSFGSSKNGKKMAFGGRAGNDLKNAIFNMDPTESSKALGRAIIGGLKGLGGSKAKKQEEEMWYAAVGHIIREVIR
ncbi:MAG: hypothetical protein ACOX8H_12875 [Ruminococcus sp.]|jgi:hypothetical protein